MNFKLMIKKVYVKIIVDRNKKLSNTVLLLGSPRSGTTWIANIINHSNDYRFIFEPLHTKKNDEVKHFSEPIYFSTNGYDSEPKELLEYILTGKSRSFWANRFNKKIFVKKRLIKMVRANFLINYFNTFFPEVKIIYVIRNPFAVVSSAIKKNFNIGFEYSKILNHDSLVNEELSDHKEIVVKYIKKGTPFQKHFLFWCIENYVALKHIRKENSFICYYEDLVNDYENITKLMYDFLGVSSFSESKLRKIYRTPSQTTTNSDDIYNIHKWKKEISSADYYECLKILTYFKLDELFPGETKVIM